MLGQVITRQELQARWTYSEMTGRFAQEYPDGPLKAKAVTNVPFTDLTSAEVAELAREHLQGYRQDYARLMPGVTHYRCESWTKEQLLRLYVIPIVSPSPKRMVPFLSFAVGPRPRTPDGTPDMRDSRVKADATAFDQLYVQGEPVVAANWSDGNMVLAEGYFRAMMFLRSENPNERILVWVPHAGTLRYDVAV